jgi:hypothetical protein
LDFHRKKKTEFFTKMHAKYFKLKMHSWWSVSGVYMSFDDLLNLKEKVAIVTGGSRGLGSAFARAIAEAGANVAITCRHGSELGETARKIRGIGSEVLEIESDISIEIK